MKQSGIMLIMQHGLILGITRRHNNSKYGMPGGTVEPGETPSIAAIREVFEETGITVDNCVLIHREEAVSDGPEKEEFEVSCFYAISWQGEPKNSEEGEVAWKTPVEMVSSDHAAYPEYNQRALKAFKERFLHGG